MVLKKMSRLLGLIFWLIIPTIINAQANNGIAEGVSLFEAKKLPEAKKFFESYFQKNPADPLGAYYLGKIFIWEGNYEPAIKWLEKAVALDEQNSDYHLWLGRAYGIKAQKVGLLKKASAAQNVKKEFEKAVEMNPENIEARMGLLQFYAFAPGIMGGSKDKARDQAEQIKQRNAHQGHLAYGLIHAVNEQYDLAEQEYRAAIASNPNDPQPYYSLGFLFARQKQFDRASEVLEDLLSQRSDEAAVYFYLGRLSVMSGKNLDKGEVYLQKYLQTEPSVERPSFASAHLLLGHIYKQKENKELAKLEYHKALELEPDFKPAKKALEELHK